jgi:putative Mn2+ efflux pump MntP
MVYVLFIAIGLAMDAFCASVALASGHKKRVFSTGLVSSAMFGGFQAFMPLIGWVVGTAFKPFISGVDHWIAFLLLLALGSKMIIDEVRNQEEEFVSAKNVTFGLILSLAFATSIDALVVGMGLGLINIPISLVVSTIGLVTFCLSLIGTYLGIRCSGIFHNKTGIIGGFILICIGSKILIDHLFF